ncbi:TauD/TfdA family dioxygenase [Mucilaginibacter sp. 21P]|uniref:TauD/TfdA family dioxygenase n=1 Tax=Mucilaginibacter sp. 21P TaxID=2778902 RepID=UPI001C5683B8|nr:TauD/TfdA family dioxygenase [Mucilaginibacter sp. 21P]QXV63869.1 TauD/TfdA family dioxygenase [Mucilaginibacter sp. 21P]
MKVVFDEQAFPFVITFEGTPHVEEIAQWYNNNSNFIDRVLYDKGAILIKGTNVDTVSKFEQLTGSIAGKFRDYVDGNYPRRNLQGHVYISTEYDQKFDITLHNELSYSEKWPSRLFFGCIISPGEGGETPLADSRKIYNRMNADLLEEFERKQVRYVRNLHNGEGMGPSWQQTFYTEDLKEVERHCNAMSIDYKWKKDGAIKLTHVRPATRIHPLTGEKVWFNQVDQYHPSHFRKELYEVLLLMADGVEEDLPLYASFGDGTKIPDSTIKEVIDTIDKEVILRPWEKADIVVVENMLVAHGRKAYKGDRQIVVSMAS